jgi:hypothetical protein
MNSTGLPKPLNTVNRKVRADTSHMIPNDGFREVATSNKTGFQNPATFREPFNAVPQMLNKENYSQQTRINRPVSAMLKTGFSSALPRHEASHGERRFGTEYAAFFGRPQSALGPVKVDHAAGLQIARKTDTERKRLLTTSLGEVYNQNDDP